MPKFGQRPELWGILGNAARNVVDLHFVYKSADESITSDTVLQNDDDLFFTALANTTYLLVMYLDAEIHATPDLKYDFNGPSGATVNIFERNSTDILGDNGANFTNAVNSSQVITGVTGLHIGVWFHGSFKTGANEGTVNFRWAQNTSDANAVTVNQGSWLAAVGIK